MSRILWQMSIKECWQFLWVIVYRNTYSTNIKLKIRNILVTSFYAVYFYIFALGHFCLNVPLEFLSLVKIFDTCRISPTSISPPKRLTVGVNKNMFFSSNRNIASDLRYVVLRCDKRQKFCFLTFICCLHFSTLTPFYGGVTKVEEGKLGVGGGERVGWLPSTFK